jgi:hypothetical protein
MVCNPTQQVGSPTQHGSHIYTQMGCGHNEYLFHPSPHLLLAVDLVTRNPTLERMQWRRHIPIIREKKNLWIECLRSINPLKEFTLILLGQEKKLVRVKLHNIYTCEILLLTLL